MLIGLGFRAGVGKDSVADYLVARHGFAKLAFAAPLKDALTLLFGWPRECLDDAEFKKTVDPHWGISPRTAMQRLGTNCLRNQFDQQFWIKLMEPKVKAARQQRIVITDVRAHNEFEAVRGWGGRLWLVQRDGAGLDGANAQHVSETELADRQDWDAVLVNNDTLEALYARVDALLQ